jgi:phenylalanyl-tRNA synthetase beta chain
MKFSLNWLKEYVNFDLTAEELAEKLNMAGQEVEEIIPIGQKLEKIITGKINKIEPHPNADKLVITEITDGTTNYQVVTGAKNVFEGAIVPISIVGSVLSNGLKIKNTKLRGIESEGMLCSKTELGLETESDGIWILPNNTPIGTDFIKYAGLKDYVLDIGILPNRGDCQSIYGMAREISAILDLPLKEPECTLNETNEDWDFQIEIQSTDNCPLYIGRLIKNIKHSESPLWMQQKLLFSGIRPISTIIDITNYILIELGQPLHAFDIANIQGKKIIVKQALENEEFQTLDEETHKLNKNALLICDTKKPVALAGVMGGKNSEINEKTQDVLLEAAYFHPTNIRRTATKLGLRTESSIRFEKGVDIQKTDFASQRACYLIQELAQGQVCKTVKIGIDKNNQAYKNLAINFSCSDINQLLGTNISEKEMLKTLNHLGFKQKDKTVVVPSWRSRDITEWPCLAEEIARIQGYDQICEKLPICSAIIEKPNKIHQLTKNIEPILINAGFYQLNTFPMISQEELKNTFQTQDQDLELTNPISLKEAVLRTQLLASLLKVGAYNHNRQVENIRVFEIGKVFFVQDNEPKEETHCAGVIMGNIYEQLFDSNEKQYNETDINYLKGIIENLLESIIQKPVFNPITLPYLHPKQALEIIVSNKVIGQLGIIHPQIAKTYNIPENTGYFSLNLNSIKAIPTKPIISQSISKFPSTRRDIAFLAPKTLTYQEIQKVIQKAKPKKVQEYFLFDCFESEKIGPNNKSLAIGFIYQAQDRTLSDEEVNNAHEKFVNQLTKELSVEIR